MKINKKILYLVTVLGITSGLQAQIAIGKDSIEGDATLLDFNNIPTNTNGIILPAVENTSFALSATPQANNGTLLFDKSDQKVKMYENNQWVDLSDTGKITDTLWDNANSSAEKGGGIIIGSETTDAKGVLVIESTDKALVLPKISNPHQTVRSPYPGMICYDTASKTLAIFDGENWNYWK